MKLFRQKTLKTNRKTINKQIKDIQYRFKFILKSKRLKALILLASSILNKISTAYCMVIVGTIFAIMYILMGKYMKIRVGLKPEKYSKQERKYDELKGN